MRTKRAQNATNGCLDSPKLGGRALPEPAGGACSAPPNPLAGFRGEGRDGEERDRPAHFLVASVAYGIQYLDV